MDRKKTLLHLCIGILGTIAGYFCVAAFNSRLLMSLPLLPRMFFMIISYWLIAAVPLVILLAAKENLNGCGFSGKNVGKQIVTGILLGLCMSFVLTLLPVLFGKGDWVNNGHNYQYLWQFLYDFVYFIGAVALTEELVFRGFIYSKIQILTNSDLSADIFSSILFGLFHFMSGNVIQVLMTGVIGLFLCLCRRKIKNCTLLSLILAHGIYDALITVWGCVF